MPEQDQPPERIWLDPEELDEHFQLVRERWKNPGSGDMEPIEDAPLMQNELTAGLRATRR